MLTFLWVCETINIIMKSHEIEATLGYLEFHLLKMVEDLEKHIPDPDVVGGMYDRAYGILSDFEQTFNAQLQIEQAEKAKLKTTPKNDG